jgi:Spy/CpxP family protein refolding chaperone
LLGWVLADLHLTPEQEGAVSDIVRDARAHAGRIREAATGLRTDLAGALRRDSFDETVAGDLLGKLDEGVDGARKQVLDVLARLHQVLDPSQRARLADLLEGRHRFEPGISL